MVLPTALLSWAAAKAAAHFYAFVSLLPVNGSMYSLSDIWSDAISSCNWFFIILQLLSHFFLLCLHSTLCTKNVCFHICISNSRVCQISLMNFFPLNIPQTALHLGLAVYLPSCVCDLGMLEPLLFLLPSIHIAFVISALYLLLFDRISLASCTWGRKLYDICISILNVIDCLCHSWLVLLCFLMRLANLH